MQSKIRALYDSNNSIPSRRARRHARDVDSVEARNVGDFGTLTQVLDPTCAVKDGKYSQWAANIRVNKLSLSGSFSISFFLGNPVSAINPLTWAQDQALIARYPVLRTAMRDNDMELIVYGAVSLTRALLSYVEAGKLKSLDAADVVPFLTENLVWHAATQDGQLLDLEELPTLKIYVYEQEVTMPTASDDLPTYGSLTHHRTVTQNKLGGLKPSDPF